MKVLSVSEYLDLILLLLGLGLVAVAVSSLFLPRGRDLLRSTQSFKGFGVSIEISLPIALLVIGVVVSGNSLLFRLLDQRSQFTALRESLSATEGRLDEARSARKMDLTILFRIKDPSISGSPPKASDLRCYYKLVTSKKPKSTTVESAMSKNQDAYTFTLTNVGLGTMIESLWVEEVGTQRRWVLESIIKATTQNVVLGPDQAPVAPSSTSEPSLPVPRKERGATQPMPSQAQTQHPGRAPELRTASSTPE